ncbi:LD-carboxypeptidase [Bacillota bacterium]
MIKPKHLNQGDRVALLAPSSPVVGIKLDLSIESIRFLGLDPVPFPSCFMSSGYLAGTDQARAKDLNDAFSDPSICGIFCLRGGYGATRILPLLDYEAISKNPKFFAGYSDITALHTVFNKLCGFITYHAPMPTHGYHNMDSFSLESLREAVFGASRQPGVMNPPGEIIKTVNPGIAEGFMTGGNLSVMASVLGSPYDVDTKGKILFIEDTEEPVYRIDRNLTALSLAGKLKDAAGIILGTFSDIHPGNEGSDDSTALNRLIDQIIRPLGTPAISNFRSGHIYPQITFPMGMMAKLNATEGKAAFLGE